MHSFEDQILLINSSAQSSFDIPHLKAGITIEESIENAEHLYKAEKMEDIGWQ